MGNPRPLPVWDRRAGKLFSEFMDDHPSTYETQPRRSYTQWLESEPLYPCRLPEHAAQRAADRALRPQAQDRHERVQAGCLSLVRRILRPGIPARGFAHSPWPQTRWELLPKRAISVGRNWRPNSNFRSKDIR